MRRKTGAEGNKETNTVPQTQEEGQRKSKELAERAEEIGWGGDKLGKEQQKTNRSEPRRNTEGRAEEPRRNTVGRGERETKTNYRTQELNQRTVS